MNLNFEIHCQKLLYSWTLNKTEYSKEFNNLYLPELLAILRSLGIEAFSGSESSAPFSITTWVGSMGSSSSDTRAAFWIWYRMLFYICLNKQTLGNQEMVRTGNPNERAKEIFFFTKTIRIVIFIFHLMLWKWSNVPKCTKFARKKAIFLRSCSCFKKFLKIAFFVLKSWR